MNIPRKVVLVITVFGVALTGALAKYAFASASDDSAPQAASTKMPVAGPNRPANVPDGYVITPFGYFHPSCVQSLTKGETLMADGRLQHPNGTVEEKAAVCSYPHFTRSGISSSAPEAKTPEINGWLENANVTTNSATRSYGALIATWRVPPQPHANDGQVLYYFPGLEDIQDTQSILQPVLGWYWGQWTLASWNCCINGVITNSPAVNVSPGDLVYGSITSTCPPGTLTCPTWNVLSVDLSTGESTTLSNTPSDGQAFNWAFEGVLEAYYVVACDDFPRDRRLTFEYVVLFNENLHPIFDPQWSGSTDSTATPWCDYHVRSSAHSVTLDY
jgi:hypothetical protein